MVVFLFFISLLAADWSLFHFFFEVAAVVIPPGFVWGMRMGDK
jgi:hypothetical protein